MVQGSDALMDLAPFVQPRPLMGAPAPLPLDS